MARADTAAIARAQGVGPKLALRIATELKGKPITDGPVAAFHAQAVLIASPTPTHADYIERAAAAGRAVFCEKPIDLSATRVRACLDAVRRAGTPLMVGFNRRFDPHFAALRQRLAAGEIGRLVMEALKSLDDVAYVRFASVYRNFREAKDFHDVLGELRGDDDREVLVRLLQLAFAKGVEAELTARLAEGSEAFVRAGSVVLALAGWARREVEREGKGQARVMW